MKKILTLIAVLLIAGTVNAQLLYKISGKGLKKASYIVGTHHLVDGKFCKEIKGLDQVMTDVEQVCGELEATSMFNPDSIKMMSDAMMLPEGQTIKTLLTDEEFVRLNEFCKKYVGIGMDNDMLFGQMGKLTPSTLVTQFSVLLYLRNHQGEFNPQNGIDTYLQNEAKAKNKKVTGFETMAFQVGVLLKSAPMKRQIEQLMCLIDAADEAQKLSERITNSYKAQDLDDLLKASEEKKHDLCDSTPEEEETLIYGRNKDWAKKMPKMMTDNSTLFVVGSLHLPGDKGVLQLLKSAGYTVEAVK